MNKDIKRILEELKEDVEENILVEVRGIYFKPLLDYITNLQEENKKLQDRLDEAIDYIENPRHEMSVKTYQELENILKGEDNE